MRGREGQRRGIDVISNTADYSAKLTANFNYFAINRRAQPRGLSVVLARTIRALTQLRGRVEAEGGRRRTAPFFVSNAADFAVPRRRCALPPPQALPSKPSEIFHSIVNREGTRYTREVTGGNRQGCLLPATAPDYLYYQPAYAHPTRYTVNICLDM